MSLKLLVSIRFFWATYSARYSTAHADKTQAQTPCTSTYPSKVRADIRVLVHTPSAGKQVQVQFIKAPSRSHCHTASKTDTAISEIGSVYGDVSMHKQEAIWAGFSVSVRSDVYFPRFQFRRYKRKILDLINLSVSRSGKRCSTLKALHTSHLPAPADGSYYISYTGRKKI